MKKLMICTLALSMITLFSGCNNLEEEEPILQQEKFEMLKGTWSISKGSIIVDDEDRSAHYPNFSMLIGKNTYSSNKAGRLFSANGTWKWKDRKTDKDIILDGKEITITSLEAKKIVFTFKFAGSAVVAGTQGNYVITLTK